MTSVGLVADSNRGSAVDARPEGVPFHDLGRQTRDARWGWRKALLESVEQGDHLAPGLAAARFEEQFAAYCGARFAVATASGSAALLLSLRALGIGPGDEVVVPANTFVADVEAILLTGATPVLCDVNRTTYNLDAATVAEALGPRTRAVIAVHLFGRPAPVSEISELVESAGIAVIEDACQAMGAEADGRRCGALGEVAVFSFGRSKPFAGLGEGGAVLTSDRDLADRLRLLNRHGRRCGDHLAVGFNFRMHPLEAAVLAARMAYVDDLLLRRRAVAARYIEAFAPLGIVCNPLVKAPTTHSYYTFVVEAEERDELERHLSRRGIGHARHYALPIHRQAAHRSLATAGPLLNVEAISMRMLSLPLFNGITDSEADLVADCLRSFFTPRHRRPLTTEESPC